MNNELGLNSIMVMVNQNKLDEECYSKAIFSSVQFSSTSRDTK